MTNLDRLLKSRDITLLTKVHLVKAMVFPVVICGCETWTIKKAECQRTVVLEKTLESPWTARRSNQFTLKEISPGCSLEGLMLKLKLQYSGHLMWRTDSLEKTLMLGKIEGGRRMGQQRMRWLDGITDSMDMSLSSSGSWWWTGRASVLQSVGLQRVGHDRATELNWTELNCTEGASDHLSQTLWRSRREAEKSWLRDNDRLIPGILFETFILINSEISWSLSFMWNSKCQFLFS